VGQSSDESTHAGEGITDALLELFAIPDEGDVRADGAGVEKDAVVDVTDVGASDDSFTGGNERGFAKVGRDVVILGEVVERATR